MSFFFRNAFAAPTPAQFKKAETASPSRSIASMEPLDAMSSGVSPDRGDHLDYRSAALQKAENTERQRVEQDRADLERAAGMGLSTHELEKRAAIKADKARAATLHAFRKAANELDAAAIIAKAKRGTGTTPDASTPAKGVEDDDYAATLAKLVKMFPPKSDKDPDGGSSAPASPATDKAKPRTKGSANLVHQTSEQGVYAPGQQDGRSTTTMHTVTRKAKGVPTAVQKSDRINGGLNLKTIFQAFHRP